jgi:hypothetical protein
MVTVVIKMTGKINLSHFVGPEGDELQELIHKVGVINRHEKSRVVIDDEFEARKVTQDQQIYYFLTTDLLVTDFQNNDIFKHIYYALEFDQESGIDIIALEPQDEKSTIGKVKETISTSFSKGFQVKAGIGGKIDLKYVNVDSGLDGQIAKRKNEELIIENSFASEY